MKRFGFTLIELLVVLGILALLLAVLLPVFTRVREKGRQAVCLSNERQLGAALLMYTYDSDDYVPPGGDAWAGEVYPYVKSMSVFHCPSDGTDAQPPFFPISYGLNANLLHLGASATGRKMMVPHSTADLSGKTVVLFEVAHSAAELTTPLEDWRDDTVPSSTSAAGNGFTLAVVGVSMASGVRFDIDEDVRYATGVMNGNVGFVGFYEGDGRHQGGANFLFPEGHARWLPPQRVSTGGDAASPADAPQTGMGPQTAAGSENARFAATFSTK